jgi:GDP-L-fucose synthase
MVHMMKHHSGAEIVNLGSGQDLSIAQLVELVCDVVGYDGAIVFDPSRPDGVPRKVVDTAFAASLGWRSKITLREGLERTYRWYRELPQEEGPATVRAMATAGGEAK